MLQDLEAGNPLEIEALIGAIMEMGRFTSTPTPVLELVYALVKLLNKGKREPSCISMQFARAANTVLQRV